VASQSSSSGPAARETALVVRDDPRVSGASHSAESSSDHSTSRAELPRRAECPHCARYATAQRAQISARLVAGSSAHRRAVLRSSNSRHRERSVRAFCAQPRSASRGSERGLVRACTPRFGGLAASGSGKRVDAGLVGSATPGVRRAVGGIRRGRSHRGQVGQRAAFRLGWERNAMAATIARSSVGV
jgi:hypothetical protein